MTAMKALFLSLTLAVAVALTGEPGAAAGRPGPGTTSSVRLKTITARVNPGTTSLVLEASEPFNYVATRLDALTVQLDLRDVVTDGVANKVSSASASPITAVTVEAGATDVSGAAVSRLRVSLKQAVAYRVRSDRNTIVVDFDKTSDDSALFLTKESSERPNAMSALSTVTPTRSAAATANAALAMAVAQAQLPQQPGTTTTQPRRFSGTPVSFDFEDADLAAVLRLFQQVSGLNMIIDPGIQAKVSMVLRDVPWDQALDQVLKANKLGIVVDDTIVRIAPISVLADEAAQRRKLSDEQALSGELQIMTKTLSYAKANEVQPIVKGLLSARGSILIDARTNTLIVTDLQDRLTNVEGLVTTLDRPQLQVEIEARIVQTNRDYARQLGVNWGFNGRLDPALGNTTNLAFPNSATLSSRTNLSTPATSTVQLAMGSINGSFNLDVALTAAENSGNLKVLSTPKVTTLNNMAAEMTQGVQIPYQTTANQTTTVQFKDAALQLKVTPQITASGTIIMNVFLENATPDFSKVGPGQPPPIDTQRAVTTLLVNDGDTTVIGGIYTNNQQTANNKTPGFGSVPLLGWLFKSENIQDRSAELLIFITPRIIR